MNRAFIFDMDGVLVDSERAWQGDEMRLLRSMFGDEIASACEGTLVGTSIRDTYARARDLGATVSYERFSRRYDEVARTVYARAQMADGLEVLGKKLTSLGYVLGLVSSSPHDWIRHVLPRLPFRNQLKVIISIADTPTLKGKPNPDGYAEGIRLLDADPRISVVLEDSNPGIQAAKAAGCFVIGFRGLLLPAYEQTGADAYAETMEDVAVLVDKKETAVRRS